jgi:ketosteroid isomerase-like protein
MFIAALLLAATTSPFDQVVAAERAFAAASVKDGFHESFLANLAPDAIAFRPLPGPARAAHEGQPHSNATLNWGPAWVAVSSAGDLALSTGPWEVRPDDKAIIGVTTGLFVSVWRRQAGGAWKVAVDAGIGSRLTFAIPTSVENGSAPAKTAPARPSDAANARLGITAAERQVSAAAKSGIGGAVLEHIEPTIRVYREHRPVAVGVEAARALLAGDRRKATCTPDKIITSSSGDLGYAYGTCAGEEDGKPAGYGFLHVWRKQTDGVWKILIDVTP